MTIGESTVCLTRRKILKVISYDNSFEDSVSTRLRPKYSYIQFAIYFAVAQFAHSVNNLVVHVAYLI